MSKTPIHWKVEKSKKTRKGQLLEGLPIIDAEKPMAISINIRDIIGSKKSDAKNCAAARALKRECGSEARVFLTRTYIKVGKKWQRFLTPQAISREIVAFDRGAPFEPGEYTLNAPSKTQRLDFKRPSGAKKRMSKRIRTNHITTSIRKKK